MRRRKRFFDTPHIRNGLHRNERLRHYLTSFNPGCLRWTVPTQKRHLLAPDFSLEQRRGYEATDGV